MSASTIPDPFTVKAETDAAVDTVEETTAYEYDVRDVVLSGPNFRHGDVIIGLVDVTQAIATEWLTRYNTHNRNAIASAIAGYTRDMTAGDWLFIGDTLRFAVNPDGVDYVADGQNRLEGIRKSGESQTYIVVVGLEADAQTVMDTQKARTFANTLGLEWVEGDEEPWSDTNRLGAIVRRTWVFEYTGKATRGGGFRTPTKTELRKHLSKHADRFRQALTVTQAAASAVPKLGKSATMIGAAYFILSQKDQGAADLFFREMVIKGFGLSDTHPVTHLRRRYGNTGVGFIDDDEAFRLTFAAWNHWKKGNQLERTLQVPRNGWPADFRDYPIS